MCSAMYVVQMKYWAIEYVYIYGFYICAHI